jgi:hypothetical protein
MTITDNTLWQQEVENCKLCGGTGSVEIAVAGTIRIEICKCASRAITQDRIYNAGIPCKLYAWDLRKLGKSFQRKNKEALSVIKKYLASLDLNIKKGKGLWISAPPGLGKNNIICYILRVALEKDYSAQYVKSRKIISIKFDAYKDPSARKLLNRITEKSHIVAIADIEKGPILPDIENFRVQIYYETLTDLDDSKTALLISSNVPKLEVLKRMPSYMQSRFWNMQEVVLRYTKDVHGSIEHG